MKKKLLMMMVMVVVLTTMVFAEEWVLPEIGEGDRYDINMYITRGYLYVYEIFEKNEDGESLYVMRLGANDLDYYICFLDTLENIQPLGQSIILTSMFGSSYDIYQTMEKWRDSMSSFSYTGSSSGKKWTCYATDNYIEALGKINPKVLDAPKKTNAID